MIYDTAKTPNEFSNITIEMTLKGLLHQKANVKNGEWGYTQKGRINRSETINFSWFLNFQWYIYDTHPACAFSFLSPRFRDIKHNSLDENHIPSQIFLYWIKEQSFTIVEQVRSVQDVSVLEVGVVPLLWVHVGIPHLCHLASLHHL